jgi:LysM repeat protein
MKFKYLIVLLIVTQSVFAINLQKTDSLRTEIVNNVVYIIHKVESGQTFYSLINKYECSVAEVMVLNPTLNNQTNLKVGQDLKFPMIKNGKHISAWGYQKALAKPNASDSETKNTVRVNSDYHVVSANETVYSLAKTYNLEMIDLVEANRITENKISVGQKLLISKSEIAKILKSNSFLKPKEYKFPTEPKGKNITEQGVAQVINTTNRSRNFLALHKNAPVGTIIKVTNEANGTSINAKVVGSIDKNGPDQDLLIKLSPYAFYQLKPKDSKLRAKVDYYTSN